MYYFLANRILVASEDKDGIRTPLSMNIKEDAEEFVKNMNGKYDDRVFQTFHSNTKIEIHETDKADAVK